MRVGSILRWVKVPAALILICILMFAVADARAQSVADFFAASPPDQAPLHRTGLAEVDTPAAPYLLFRSRAPPTP